MQRIAILKPQRTFTNISSFKTWTLDHAPSFVDAQCISCRQAPCWASVSRLRQGSQRSRVCARRSAA
eukprot:6199507-Pleurochrysis_carterae.AAC.1